MVKNGETTKLAGEYESKVVAGFRVAIPSQLRKALAGDCIITKGYEECLIIVPSAKWEKLVKPLEESSFFDRNIRDTLRFLVGSAHEVSLDKQGRFVVPQILRSYAHLDETDSSGEVIFIGLMNWIEVWDKKMWQHRVEYIENNADSIAQELKILNNGAQ